MQGSRNGFQLARGWWLRVRKAMLLPPSSPPPAEPMIKQCVRSWDSSPLQERKVPGGCKLVRRRVKKKTIALYLLRLHVISPPLTAGQIKVKSTISNPLSFFTPLKVGERRAECRDDREGSTEREWVRERGRGKQWDCEGLWKRFYIHPLVIFLPQLKECVGNGCLSRWISSPALSDRPGSLSLWSAFSPQHKW